MVIKCHSLRICHKKHNRSANAAGRTTATPISSVAFTYDANGALLTDDLRHYAYDSDGRLAAASLGWSSAATTDDSITKYAHNAQAQRVFKTAPLFTQTNPDPTARQTVIDALTAFFESLWNPTTVATQKTLTF